MEEEKRDNVELEKRKEKAIKILKKYGDYIQYIILVVIIWLSYKIRTANLPFLKDITTGKYIPADPDALAFLRYSQYILQNGNLMAVDTLRYYPLGFTGVQEFSLLSHLMVYLYKFLHFFNQAVTIEYASSIGYRACILFPFNKKTVELQGSIDSVCISHCNSGISFQNNGWSFR